MAKDKINTPSEKSNEELLVVIEEQGVVIAELISSNEEKDAIILELTAAVSATSKNVVAKMVTVKHDGVEYEVAIPKFKFEGVEYTTKELVKDKELIAKLIKIESGVLVAIG